MNNHLQRTEEEKIALAKVTIQYLNELVALDREVMHELVEGRVPCNEAIARHPTVQVSRNEEDERVLGLLGVINGLIGVDKESWGYVARIFDEDGNLTGFGLSPEFTSVRESTSTSESA